MQNPHPPPGRGTCFRSGRVSHAIEVLENQLAPAFPAFIALEMETEHALDKPRHSPLERLLAAFIAALMSLDQHRTHEGTYDLIIAADAAMPSGERRLVDLQAENAGSRTHSGAPHRLETIDHRRAPCDDRPAQCTIDPRRRLTCNTKIIH